MHAEPGAVQLKIGHVLFMDMVGYSKLLVDEQRELQEQLSQIVRGTNQVRAAEQAEKLIRIPTGDGMALVFFNSPEAPIRCAVEIGHALRSYPEIRLRMGIHSGPVNEVQDVNDRTNIAGAGINIAQRVMDCGDAGHILLSKRAADDLAHSRQWRPHLHELGDCALKHATSVFVVNLYNDEIGNPDLPKKFKESQTAVARPAKRNVIIAAAVVLALIAAAAFWFHSRKTNFSPSSGKSIAVLPFEVFSDDKSSEFFADGIQDDILTSLAKIHDLRVISRTSVEQYRGHKKGVGLRDIAAALGVSNILEGSVRGEGNRVAVNAQLIDAGQDRHLWANRYEATLNNSLAIQGQLAREIAEALRATLTPEEKARVSQKPTSNPQAYDLYLQARHYEFRPDNFLQDYRTAEQLYTQAITLDPKFAVAHAGLARTCARIYHFYEPTETWSKRARNEAETAIQLDPSAGEGHHALGLCYYWFKRDYGSALREFAIAKTLLPNDSQIPWHIAAIKRRQGRWQEAEAAYQEILALDPQNPNIVRDSLYTYCDMRDWPKAEAMATRLIGLTPDSFNAKAQIGYVNFWIHGTTARLKSEMTTVPAGQDPDGAVTACRIDAALIDRDVTAAEQALRSSQLDTFSYFNAVDAPRSYFAGLIALMHGDNVAAQKELSRARDFFAAAAAEAPDVPERHAFFGLTCALLGEKERAISEGKRAVELRPESQDALDGTIFKAVLALIYARTGENAHAIELIRYLLSIPGAVDSANYSITVNDLKHRWDWDPLRSDPEFQKLLAKSRNGGL
jgi:TolB-like protein/class 3 adenylate cyclase/Tfp pilus assembly protein PilF